MAPNSHALPPPLEPRKQPAAVAGPTPTYELLFEGIEPTGDLWLYWDGQPWYQLVNDAVGPERVYDCLYPLKTWYRGMRGASWVGSPLPDQELLGCFEPDWLRNLIFAARGYPFSKAQWQTAFGGRFLPSELPYEDAWLNEKERLAVDALKGM